MRVRVANALLPLSPRVHLGGRIQFSTTLPEAPEDTARAVWSSENDRIMRYAFSLEISCTASRRRGGAGMENAAHAHSARSVDPHTGIGEARGLGRVLIYHTGAINTFAPVLLCLSSYFSLSLFPFLSLVADQG